MKFTDNEIANIEALLFGLNKHKNSTLTIEFNNEKIKMNGAKFDKEITESIRTTLTRVVKEHYAKQ